MLKIDLLRSLLVDYLLTMVIMTDNDHLCKDHKLIQWCTTDMKNREKYFADKVSNGVLSPSLH